MAEREEELKSLLMKVKEESEKIGLKRNIQKTKIMASGPIASWQIDGETVETVSDFIFGGSKITTDSDCSHKIKRCLLLGRKVMTNLDSILKSRDITLPTKVCLVKAMVFPGLIYGYESWTVKTAECQRIDAFELWCWRRLLKVPWTAVHQTSLFIKLTLMSIESVMPSNYLILCRPLLLPPSIFPSIRVFSNESFFASGGQSIRVSASTSVLPMNT